VLSSGEPFGKRGHPVVHANSTLHFMTRGFTLPPTFDPLLHRPSKYQRPRETVGTHIWLRRRLLHLSDCICGSRTERHRKLIPPAEESAVGPGRLLPFHLGHETLPNPVAIRLGLEPASWYWFLDIRSHRSMQSCVLPYSRVTQEDGARLHDRLGVARARAGGPFPSGWRDSRAPAGNMPLRR